MSAFHPYEKCPCGTGELEPCSHECAHQSGNDMCGRCMFRGVPEDAAVVSAYHAGYEAGMEASDE